MYSRIANLLEMKGQRFKKRKKNPQQQNRCLEWSIKLVSSAKMLSPEVRMLGGQNTITQKRE